MKSGILIGVAALAFAAGATMGWAPQDTSKPKPPAAADDAAAKAEADMMKMYEAYAKPGVEHARLAKKVGTWNLAVKYWPMPDMEPGTTQNTSTFVMEVGGRYLLERVEGLKAEEPWGKFLGLGITGYNNGLKKYEYSWMDSMGTGIMNGVGTANSKGDISWTSEGYDPMQNKVIKTRGTEKIMPDGSMVHEMFVAGPDGKEFRQMELTYTRKK